MSYDPVIESGMSDLDYYDMLDPEEPEDEYPEDEDAYATADERLTEEFECGEAA